MPHNSHSFISGKRRGQARWLIFCNQRHHANIMHRMKVPLHNTHACFTIRVVEFLNYSRLLWFLMQQLYCISYWRSRRAYLLCKSNQRFLWDVSNLASISYLSTCLLHAPFLSRLDLCSKPFRVFVSYCRVRNPHIGNLSSEFTALIVGSVFNMRTVQGEKRMSQWFSYWD
jgi:hypothetical protein